MSEHRIVVNDITARDGLQELAVTLSMEVKIELITRLLQAGVRSMEVTSFVSAKAMPQFLDAEAVWSSLPRVDGVRYSALIANERGLERALSVGVDSVVVTGSLAALSAAHAANLFTRGFISLTIPDPWVNALSVAEIGDAVERLIQAGADQVGIADAQDVATPTQIDGMLTYLDHRGIDCTRVWLHLHDRNGGALAKCKAAIGHGIYAVDATLSGLGAVDGRPATTGLSTEELVQALDEAGAVTNVDLVALEQTAAWLRGQLGWEAA